MMTCKEFKERMYLRDDELDAAERSAMSRHVSTCAACASEYSRVEVILKAARNLKKRDPVLSDPLLLINATIGRIEQEAMREKGLDPASFADRCIMWLLRPGIRAAMACMLLLIAGSFAFEYTSAFVKMKGLEESLALKSASNESFARRGAIDQAGVLSAAADLSRIISGKRSFYELSDNWVLMNKQSLKEFMLVYHDLKANPNELPPEFRAANPSLLRLLEKDSQAAQVEMLLKEREALIRELDRLLQKEGNTP